MAGEIEDCLSFQADSLPTGSISFGRFEVESLSWERRSSFSHNRYLEEVEKYSTPGSVTQKKAYFEAHFKKKALLQQASSVSPNGVDWQSTENGIEDHAYMEEYVDDCNTRHRQFAWNDETPAVSNELEHDIMERNGGQLQFSWYDETPPAASDEDEYDVIESNEGQLQFQYDEGQALSDEHQHDLIDCKQEINKSASEPMPCNSMKGFDYPIELVEIDEVLQSQSIYDNMQSDKDNLHEVEEQKTENESTNVGELLEKCDFSSTDFMAENDSAPGSKETQEDSCNVTATVEQKPLKAKLRTTLSVAETTRKTSTEKNSLSSVKAAKILREMERVNMLRTKTEKQSFLKVPSSPSSDSKNFKHKDSENLKAQSRQGTRSVKDLGAKKEGVCPQSISGNAETLVHQCADRPKKVVYSSKTILKQSNAAFKFRSDERAEKRREFITRLEEKHHAKEVQMNEIQAKTQVQTEAELKQLRRSLNFKATPMPSFYHEAEPRESDGKKMVVTRAKSPKPPTKTTSPGIRAAPRANSTEKVANRVGPALSEPVGSNTVDYPASSVGGTSCSISAGKPDETDRPRDISRMSRSAKRTGTWKREEREKQAAQPEQRGEREARKGESVGMVRRGGARKAMKGIVDRGLAVHVAS